MPTTDPLFEYAGPHSSKVRCTVCSATGYDTNGYGWQERCLAGHPWKCPTCGRMFSTHRGQVNHTRIKHRARSGITEVWS